MSDVKPLARYFETRRKNCRRCEAEFEYVVLLPPVAMANWDPEICDTCCEQIHAPIIAEKRRQAELSRVIAEREQVEREWRALCPAKYRTREEGGVTDVGRIPAKLLDDVLSWEPCSSPQGLLLHGETGVFKSRCIWRLLRRLHVAGLSITWFDCVSFGHECAKHFGDRTDYEWLQRIYATDILFFDDLWTEAMTDRVDAELCGIVERRSRDLKPIFITTNFTEIALEEKAKQPGSRMSLDRCLKTMRRLKEDCRIITFE